MSISDFSLEDLRKSFQEEEDSLRQSEIEEIEETKIAIESKMVFNLEDIEKLSHSEHTRHLKPKKTTNRGRPKGSVKTADRNQIKNDKLTFTLCKFQKDELIEKAKKSERTLSDYIIYVIRRINKKEDGKTINRKSIISNESENQKKEDLEKVSITISLTKDENNRIKKYCIEKLNRKIADGVRYILKYPNRIKGNILPKEKI